ncbi:MAG: hypothetical protein ACJA1A_003661 [Saprospiraceae bacterium]|jgi:hypothetical protein
MRIESVLNLSTPKIRSRLISKIEYDLSDSLNKISFDAGTFEISEI